LIDGIIYQGISDTFVNSNVSLKGMMSYFTHTLIPKLFTFISVDCVCQDGWSGSHCSEYSLCSDGSCFHNSSCIPFAENISRACFCSWGWQGVDCDVASDGLSAGDPMTFTGTSHARWADCYELLQNSIGCMRRVNHVFMTNALWWMMWVQLIWCMRQIKKLIGMLKMTMIPFDYDRNLCLIRLFGKFDSFFNLFLVVSHSCREWIDSKCLNRFVTWFDLITRLLNYWNSRQAIFCFDQYWY